ncbi:MAG: 50S ribosomal protein L27 [Bacilli bacterium]|nr:50S ribosomal protein L27 [Bacilli bacterium]
MNFKLDLQFFASKKGVGSVKNGRDSISKRLGMKKSDGQIVKTGNIIFRQRGTKIMCGKNTKRGKDDTIFSLINGVLKYERTKNNKVRASVYPIEN